LGNNNSFFNPPDFKNLGFINMGGFFTNPTFLKCKIFTNPTQITFNLVIENDAHLRAAHRSVCTLQRFRLSVPQKGFHSVERDIKDVFPERNVQPLR
jgi:hypothetical protein